jgi:orotidine-5'-phosphate decarboxylase
MFLTVHGYPQTMRAAVAAAKGSGLRLLAVTVLTNLLTTTRISSKRAIALASSKWCGGARSRLRPSGSMASSQADKAWGVCQAVSKDMILVTPGIRPAGAGVGGQKCVATPASAISAGADYLVIGRPISTAADPRATATPIVAEIAAAAS